MTTTETAFDASVYDLPIPKIDGLKADKLSIVFSGNLDLDRTSAADLELLDKFRLGVPVTLQVEAVCVGKPTSYRPDEDGPGTVTHRTVLRVTGLDWGT